MLCAWFCYRVLGKGNVKEANIVALCCLLPIYAYKIIGMANCIEFALHCIIKITALRTLFFFITMLYAGIVNGVFAQSSNSNFTLFGRGIYPGDDTTYHLMKSSGFNTIILSSFYIHADGDVYSGDDSKHPIIHNGKYVGDPVWLQRIAALKRQPSNVTRIEILLEGRWYNQPPNTYDFIKDWADETNKAVPAGVIAGTGTNSTLYAICKVFKEQLGVDAICIDDESVYDSRSIIKLGEIAGKLGMHMTLCPFTNKKYWKAIVDGSQQGLIDAIYLQCYDGGTRNTPAPWHDSVATNIPVYPIFLCRGAFDKCTTNHNSKTPDEIKAEMIRFKKDYPGMSGGAIWQIADVKNYIKLGCAGKEPASGSATSASEYLQQLYKSLKEEL